MRYTAKAVGTQLTVIANRIARTITAQPAIKTYIEGGLTAVGADYTVAIPFAPAAGIAQLAVAADANYTIGANTAESTLRQVNTVTA